MKSWVEKVLMWLRHWAGHGGMLVEVVVEDVVVVSVVVVAEDVVVVGTVEVVTVGHDPQSTRHVRQSSPPRRLQMALPQRGGSGAEQQLAAAVAHERIVQ